MTFDASATHPGYTVTNAAWWNNQIIYPTNPNVNGPHMRITKNSGCFSVTSVRTAPFGGGGGTWEIRTNRGHSYQTMIPGVSTVHTLNFNDIQWIEMALINAGTGGTNNTFDFDDVVYTEPVYTPADAPGLSASVNNTCPGTSVTITATGNLNDASNWVFYNGGSCSGTPIQNSASATLSVSPSTTTTYSAKGVDAYGCVVAGSCGSITIISGDVTAPTAVCQNVTTYLDGAGSTTITASDLDGGSTDNCTSVSVSASQTSFTCADVGVNSITLTATDGYANSANCMAVVTVTDTVSPVATCQDIILYLDGTGNGNVAGSDLDGGSSDNCSLGSWSASPSSFTCANIGTNNVTLMVTDNSSNTATCVAVVTVSTSGAIWTGSTSSDWNNAANWCAGAVPTSSDHVSISSSAVTNPIINDAPASPAVCNNLTIGSGASLTIDAGKALTVAGATINEGTITIKSDGTGIGSFLDNGSIGGSGLFEMEQYLTGSGGATPDGLFHYVGSPVAGAVAGTFDLASGNKLWSADETTLAYMQITNESDALNVMEGYAVRMGTTGSVTYSGSSFNTGTQQVLDLSRTGTTSLNRGYNLVSNPYPSTLDWDNSSKNNLEETIWMRTHQGSTMTFDTYNALSGVGTNNNGNGDLTGNIPPTQAFWVLVVGDGNTGALGFDNSVRSHGTQTNIYKAAAEEGMIRIALSDGNVSDEQIVLFNPAAQSGYDSYDSQKFWASNIPQLYSNIAGDTLTINGLNNPTSTPTVALGMKLPAQGNYTLNATSITFTETGVYLEDAELNVFQDLNITPEYAFTSTAGNIGNRFILHFGMTAVGIEDGTLANSRVYTSNGNQLNIILSDNTEKGSVQVFDMAGRAIRTANLNASRSMIDLNTQTGVYLIRVETEKGADTHKVVLQ